MTVPLVFGLDLAAAKWGISRDLKELTLFGPLGFVILAVIAGLPVGSILVLVLRRRLLALAPLGISMVLFLLWVLYYATDDDSQPDVEAHRAKHRAKHASDDGDSSEPDVEAHLFKM